ncbi:hypothetical protein QTG54_007040, partial [Skeletonema marinoi]
VDTALTSSNSGDTNNAGGGEPSGTADNAQSEKEKMQQKLKEAREQAAAAKEKKKSKKSKKHEKWLKEQQQQQVDRTKSWTDKVKREEEQCYLISDLIGTEFQRVNKGMEMNEEIQKVITDKSKEAHDAMYGSNIKCRVVVVGLDRKDINGRKGSIHHWNEDKGKFCVGLDTKKSRDCDVHFFKPENLDVVTSAQSVKKDGKLAANFIVSITGVTKKGGDDVGCQFSLEKSDVTKLQSAHSRSNGLQEFREERDALAHRLMKEQEEQRKEEERLEKEEEEDRKRRAELRAKKRAEKELKKGEQRQRREKEFKLKQMQAQMEWERKQAEEMREVKTMLYKVMFTQQFARAYQAYFHAWADDGGSVEDFDDFKKEFKEDLSEQFEELFELDELDEILEEIFEKTDEKFKEMLLKDRLEDDKKHAGVLGVSHDVDKRTLQKTYRKLALQYHPDKWSANSAHGMSKEEAEEHFKSIRSSYDHLMANFDE